jgi:hypothetical protein
MSLDVFSIGVDPRDGIARSRRPLPDIPTDRLGDIKPHTTPTPEAIRPWTVPGCSSMISLVEVLLPNLPILGVGNKSTTMPVCQAAEIGADKRSIEVDLSLRIPLVSSNRFVLSSRRVDAEQLSSSPGGCHGMLRDHDPAIITRRRYLRHSEPDDPPWS